MSKSSTISLDVLNALSPQGMLNASVKELENQVFTFHSIVAPAEKTADLTAVSDNSYVKARYINSKNKEFLDPNQGLLNLGIVRWVGTTKVKALDLKQKLQSE
jgi:hypothetical protein